MKYFIQRIPLQVKLIRGALPSSRTPNPWSPGSHWWFVDFNQCGRFRRNLDTFGSVNLSGMDFCSFVRLDNQIAAAKADAIGEITVRLDRQEQLIKNQRVHNWTMLHIRYTFENI